MVAPTTTDKWDEYVTKVISTDIAPVTTFTLGLYSDSTDTITAADDLAAITTEPDGGGGYATKGMDVVADSNVTVAADSTIVFSNQTFGNLNYAVPTTVDAWYIKMTVQLEGDGAPTEHLMAVGTLDGGPYDLQNYPTFTVDTPSIGQTQG